MSEVVKVFCRKVEIEINGEGFVCSGDRKHIWEIMFGFVLSRLETPAIAFICCCLMETNRALIEFLSD